MSRRTLRPGRLRYKLDYVSYWSGKGEYGKERVRRMRERKKKRWEKCVRNCPSCRNKKAARYEHLCPFDQEMSYNPTKLCRCCSDCTHNCAMDV